MRRPLVITIRGLAEAWENAVMLTLKRDTAVYDPAISP
jgi:hypothetical protein